MSNLPHETIGAFIDAVVCDPSKADQMLAEHAELLNARWIHDETVPLHAATSHGYVDVSRLRRIGWPLAEGWGQC